MPGVRKGAQLETLGCGRRMLRQSVIPASPEEPKEQLQRITRIMKPKLSIEEDKGTGAACCWERLLRSIAPTNSSSFLLIYMGTKDITRRRQTLQGIRSHSKGLLSKLKGLNVEMNVWPRRAGPLAWLGK